MNQGNSLVVFGDKMTTPGLSVRRHSASVGTVGASLEEMIMHCEIAYEDDQSLKKGSLQGTGLRSTRANRLRLRQGKLSQKYEDLG